MIIFSVLGEDFLSVKTQVSGASDCHKNMSQELTRQWKCIHEMRETLYNACKEREEVVRKMISTKKDLYNKVQTVCIASPTTYT